MKGSESHSVHCPTVKNYSMPPLTQARFHPAPLALAVALAMFAPRAAYAQVDTAGGPSVNLSIAAQPLSGALNELSAATGMAIGFSPAFVAGKTGQAVNGNLTVMQAVDQLLRGTGLVAVREGDGIVLKLAPPRSRDSATEMAPVTVSAQVERDGTTEGTGSYTTNRMRTATKLDLSIRETPQSVTVITSQMIEDRRIDDFDTLMRNVTGVRVDKGVQDARAGYSLRGFEVDYYQMDGIPIFGNWYVISNFNLDKFDRIEIVKGANGLTTGAGGPGAAINMVRKHANSKEFTGTIDASVGNWNTYKIKADVSTPLNEDGSVRGRLVASRKETDTFKERVHNKTDLLYGVIDADITSRTTISAGASYEIEDLNGDSNNLPAFYTDGTRTRFARSKNYTPDWASWDTERMSYFVGGKHRFLNEASLNATYTHNNVRTKDRLYGYLGIWSTGLRRDGSGLTYEDAHMPQTIKEDNMDVYASIPFRLADKDHEVIAGLQFNRQKISQKKYGENTYNISDFLNQNGSELAYAGDNLPGPWLDEYTRQTALYLTGRVSLHERVKLIAGARLTSWKYDSTFQGDPDQKYDVKNKVTPFAGIVFDLDKHHSAYASYTNIFKPQDYKDINERLLAPLVGNNHEVGIKGEYFDRRLNTALSLFRIEQDNAPVRTDVRRSNGAFAYRAAKGVVSQGVELEIAGRITPHWDVSLGVTHFDAEEASGIKYNTRAARNNLNLFTKYSFDKFGFGVGVNWKSRGYVGSGTGVVSQNAYAIVDVMASYEISKQFFLQLNVNNVFDKTYYSGYTSLEYAYGEPINGMVSLRYKF